VTAPLIRRRLVFPGKLDQHYRHAACSSPHAARFLVWFELRVAEFDLAAAVQEDAEPETACERPSGFLPVMRARVQVTSAAGPSPAATRSAPSSFRRGGPRTAAATGYGTSR
jgi:hypothetical protein